MSIQSLITLAEDRDAMPGGEPVARMRGTVGVAATEQAPPENQARRTDVLVQAIPTEVLGPYTALVAIVVATIGEGESSRSALRWALYAGGLLAIAIWIGSAYARQPEKQRRLPVAELLAALVAFGAWGLVMPGSPLSISVTGDDLAIATAIITTVGVFLVTIGLGDSLKTGSTAQRSESS